MELNLSSTRDIADLARFLQMIGNPLRLEILFCLLEQPCCVCELSSKLNHRQPCISQHLMRLRQAGLVNAKREGWKKYYFIPSPGVKKYLLCLQENWQGGLFNFLEHEKNA
ncbi:helix-turn-helix transcriptional regulator [Anaerolinea thermophila]|uniref:ArsR/SmtB family transcription factor n=1 Tax=Anaerolinea thermophila TaxID=167964 RepID=UPI0026F1CD8C|nr:metalloregulator ArsR/SmtB family transcription factor [Anaerolinea thermophila]